MIDAVGRLLAWQQGSAVPIRATSALSEDPEGALGIAVVRLAGEERIQAIAVGPITGEPTISVSWNALDRNTRHLDALARTLDRYLRYSIASGQVPRLWTGAAALKCLELLAYRYRRNPNTNGRIRRLAALCGLLAHEACYPGQQVVVVAEDLLRAHVVTGQSADEDQHLGTLLAWLSPSPGTSALEEANRRALQPASGLLERLVDNRIERLRVSAKRQLRGGATKSRRRIRVQPAGKPSREVIEDLLREGVRREWDLLVEARRAFRGLRLPVSPGTKFLDRLSFDRMSYELGEDRSLPSRPHALSRYISELEHLLALVEGFDVRYDRCVRERKRAEGRVFMAEVVGVVQPRPNRKPCMLLLRTEQEILRVREGTRLQVLDARVDGRVTVVRSTGQPGEALVELELKRGVRERDRPPLGARVDLADTVLLDTMVRQRQVYREMRIAPPTLLERKLTPPPSGADAPVAADLLDFLDDLRGMTPQ
jgi:hypothetical protein